MRKLSTNKMIPDVEVEVKEKTRIALKILLVLVIPLSVILVGGIFFLGINTSQKRLADVTCQILPKDYAISSPQDQTQNELSTIMLKNYTDSLSESLKKVKDFRSNITSDFKSLSDLLQERKEKLIATMKSDASIAFESIFSKNERRVLRAKTNNCVEQLTTIEGVVEASTADFPDNISVEQYVIVTNKGERVILHPANVIEGPKSGTQVRATGFRIDDHFLVNADTSASGPNASSSTLEILASPTSEVIGEQKTIVLMGYPSGVTPPNITHDDAYDIVFNPEENSIQSYYDEVSYSKVSFSGDIYGWVELTDWTHTCYEGEIIPRFINAFDQAYPEINFTEYSRYIIVAPFACPWMGYASLGKYERTTPDGQVMMSHAIIDVIGTGAAFNPYVVGHEIGHGLGLRHAHFYDCEDSSLREYFPPELDACNTIEYGDYYSVMGGVPEVEYLYTPRHLHAPDREWLGWFDETRTIEFFDESTIAPDGIYILTPIESNEAGIKALKFKHSSGDCTSHGGTKPCYFYIEYRQPIGFDETADFGATADVFNGPLFHTSNGLYTVGQNIATWLIDATVPPVPPSWNTSSLPIDYISPINNSPYFIDIMSGAEIRVLSNDIDESNPKNSRLTLEIYLGRIDVTYPEISPQTPSHGETVSGEIPMAVTATDNVGIDRVKFYSTHLNWFATVTEPTTPGGDIYQITLDTTHVPNGWLNLRAKAYDTFIKSTITEDWTWRVNVQNTDEIYPTIEITYPKEGYTIKWNSIVQTNAEDNIGIWKVEFYLDDQEEPYVVYEPPYILALEDVLQSYEGQHTLVAKAYDFVRNITVTQVSFRTSFYSAPLVSFISPENNAKVQDTINLEVNVEDESEINGVIFWLDDDPNPIGFTTSEPYRISWDTKSVADGNHSLKATAYNVHANSNSDTITVKVNNYSQPIPKPKPIPTPPEPVEGL